MPDRKIYCEIFRDGDPSATAFAFRTEPITTTRSVAMPTSKPRSKHTTLRNERIWVEPGPGDPADVALKADEYKPDTEGWRMEQANIKGPRRSPTRRRR